MIPKVGGECAHCGAKNVPLVGLRATGSGSDYLANKPACTWCFNTPPGGIIVEWEDDGPTSTYEPDVLAKSLRESKP